MYKYSIIIPHSNIPDLLQRCLDSIPKRDDVQVIVVDDNSDSSKVDFVKFPGLNKPNTEVYFTKGGRGAGYARNVGLKYVKGEWILFADCDDYFHTQAINELMDTDIPDECKAIYWGSEELYSDGTNLPLLTDSNESLREIPKFEMVLNAFAPWKKMVRATLIKKNHIFFDEIPASNDVMFQMRLLGVLAKEEIFWFPKVVYSWEERENSITTSVNIEKAKCRFLTPLRANRYAKQHGWQFVDNTISYMKHLKEISILRFYFSFYQEWWYLGLIQAKKDYVAVCSFNGDEYLLYMNPFLLADKIKYTILRRRNPR